MSTPLEPEPLALERGYPVLDDGTMEQPLDDGTLSSPPRILPAPPPGRPRAWRLVVGVTLSVALAGSVVVLPRPSSPPPEVAPQSRYADAFEDHLAVVRHEPTTRRGHAALADATLVARALALSEARPGLWTERWVAAVDRYARYWPGDPLTVALVEDAAEELRARGLAEEAAALEQHVPPENR